MTATDTAATLATPEVTAPATEPAPAVKTPRKPRFTGKLKAVKAAKPAKKSAKAAKKPVKRHVVTHAEKALRAVIKGQPPPTPFVPRSKLPAPRGKPPVPRSSDSGIIVMLNGENPCRAVEGNIQYMRFEHIRKCAGKTVEHAKRTGDDWGGIGCAIRRWTDRGFIQIVEK